MPITIEQKLKEILANYEVKEHEIKPDTTLTDLNLDSLDQLEVLMDIEAAYDMAIEDDEATELARKTIDQIVAFIKERGNVSRWT